MNIAKRDFPQLDAMRAVASIAVVATHAGFWSGFYTSGFFGVAVQRLEVGVAIFFVLSGFLLSRSYLVSAHDRVPHEPARRYFTKRFLRIFPVYVVSAVGALTLISENRSLGIGPVDPEPPADRPLPRGPAAAGSHPDVEPHRGGRVLPRSAVDRRVRHPGRVPRPLATPTPAGVPRTRDGRQLRLGARHAQPALVPRRSGRALAAFVRQLVRPRHGSRGAHDRVRCAGPGHRHADRRRPRPDLVLARRRRDLPDRLHPARRVAAARVADRRTGRDAARLLCPDRRAGGRSVRARRRRHRSPGCSHYRRCGTWATSRTPCSAAT